MFKKLAIVLAFVLSINGVATMTPSVKAASNTYYVSTTGDDSNSGTIDKPFKTIQKASSALTAGDTVYLRGGTYNETIAPITDGTSLDPIKYKAFPNETVTISGSDPVTGWTLDSGSVYKAPMNLGLGDGNQIFVNGEMMRLAQNTNWTNDLDLFDVGWSKMQSGTPTSITDTGLNKPDNYWVGATVIVKGWWSTQSVKVKSSIGSTIYFDKLPWSDQYTNPAAGGKYMIAGVKGELDRQKEWYYDALTSTLYLWAPGGVDPNELTVEAKKRKYAVDLTGRSYIHIEGINTIGGSITTKDGSYNMIKGINAKYLSHTIGLQKAYSYDDTGIDLDGNYNTIRDSEIKYSSGNGIVLRGTNNNVINNLIHETDYMGTYNATVALAGGKRHLVSYNTLYNTGRSVIGGEKFTESIIEYNDISRTGKLSYDLGGIYFARVDGGNTEIRYNWIHDMDSQDCKSCELGVYVDSNTHGFLIHHNTAWNARTSYYIGGRTDHNFIYNNQSKPRIIVLSTDYKYNNEVSNNIVEEGVQFHWEAQPGIHAYVEGNVKEGYDQHQFGRAGHNFENPPYPVFAPTRHEFSNLARNYGFEADLDGWELTGSKDVKYHFSPMLNLNDQYATTRTADGSVLFGPGMNGIEQLVTGLNPNTTYELSGWTKVSAGEEAVMGIRVGNEDLKEKVTDTKNGWKHVFIRFTTDENQISATIYLTKTSAGSGVVYGDDIGLRKQRMSELPEPPDPNLIPQSGMTATATSEEIIEAANGANRAIDGDPGTFWHTKWTPKHVPESITLDLGTSYKINKLKYLPRQDSPSGRITKYVIYVSSNGTDFVEAASGTWGQDPAEKTAEFKAVEAKYIMLKGEEAFNGWVTAAEINVFKEDPNAPDVNADKEELEIGFAVEDSAASVTQDINLPLAGSHGSEITWTSSKSSVIAADGKVTRPAYGQADAIVKLTATLTKGRVTEKKMFELVVKAITVHPSAPDVEADKAELEIGYAEGDHAASVTQDVNLPTSGSRGSLITWASVDTSVVADNGKVTRPANGQNDAVVTLTATIIKGEASETKSFDVTVKAESLKPNTDAEDVAAEKAALEIGYAGSDNTTSVTQDVNLPLSGSRGSLITWASSDTSVVADNGKVTRPANGQNDAVVTLTATIIKGEASETKSFDVTVKASPAPVNPEQPSSGQGSGVIPTPKPEITDTGVTLGGALVHVTQINENGKATKKVSIKPEVLISAFELLDPNHKDAQTVTIVLKGTEAVSKIEISAVVLAKAAKIAPDASILIQGEQAYYRLPVTLLDIASLAQELGVKEDEMIISLNIEQVTGAAGEKLDAAIQQEGISQLGQAFDFSITAEANGRKVAVNNFGTRYVERVIVVPQAVNTSELTAVLYHPETNELSFVPAIFKTENGKIEATLKRNGNSVYAIVSSKKTFTDVNRHWAKQEIELLASKLIVRGVSDTSFAPDSRITRAEFTSMLVRSLGLTPATAKASFSDVSNSDWYAGSIGAAVEAKLIEGFEDGSFRPTARITREQMAFMISRAINAAGKSIAESDSDEGVLSKFADQASIRAWARPAIAQCVNVGIISGKSGQKLDPSSDASRAEVAVMLKRFLQYVQFIN